MTCNESLDFHQAISCALQRLAAPSMVLKIFNSPLALCSLSVSHRHQSDRALILDVSLSWLAFCQCYLQRIHKDGKSILFSSSGPRRDVYYLNFV